jgi:phosphoglycerate dehydrogenase-like enzyme
MARGAVIDYEAVAELLATDALCGAVADVFDIEPLPKASFLWTTPGFFITPHISCDSPAGYVEAGLAIFGSNVQRLLEGREMLNVVDPVLQY